MHDGAGMNETSNAPRAAAPARRFAYRHRLPTRLWHWINALVVFVMLMSGLMIFNAHPHLYWGQYGANFDHPWLSFRGRPIPGWATIPSTYNLAAARRWHLAFAWLLVVPLVLFLITIQGLGQMLVIADVPEGQLGSVRVGQPAEISFPAYPTDIRRG